MQIKDKTLIGITIIFVVMLACIQMGISSGRQMQSREDGRAIAAAEERATRLGHQISVLQDALGKLRIVRELKHCESSHRIDAVGDGGKAYGEWQFWEATFRMFEAEAGLNNLDYKDPLHQDVIGAWALANGKGRHWTCYGRGATRKNTEDIPRDVVMR